MMIVNMPKGFALVMVLILVSCSNYKPLRVQNLTVNFKSNPLGIESKHPLLSWQLESDQNNVEQTTYHILVASKPELLSEAKADLWNSGLIKNSQSTLIEYAGKTLKSSQSCYWTVRVSDNLSNTSAWSEYAFFEIGLLNTTAWSNAKWIGIETDTRKSEFISRPLFTWRMKDTTYKVAHPSPLLRKSFELNEKPIKARLYVAAGGYYESYLNGEKIGNSVLNPSPTSYNKHVLYQTYDVTNQVIKGTNVLGSMLGNGFYGQNFAFNVRHLEYGEPKLIVRLLLEFKDGSQQEILSDTTWKAMCGPIVFDNVYGGETYDARYEINDWNSASLDDSQWQQAQEKPHPQGELTHHLVEPIRVIREIAPKRILKRGSKYIAEFPENISGWIKITLNEAKGTAITIKTGEAMYRDSSGLSTESTGHFATGLVQTEVYVSNGTGRVTWEPRFTYHGFQYAEISGLTKAPNLNDIKAVVVYTDLPQTGSFKSSSRVLNQIYEASIRTVMTNMHGFPEDCPHREKCGWLGDAHTTSDFVMYNFGSRNLYTKFMQDIDDNLIRGRKISPDYNPPMVPQMVAPGKRSISEAFLDWGIAVQFLPYNVYKYYGDVSLYKKYYAQIKDFTRHMLAYKNDLGTIDNGLGDWCPPLWDRLVTPEAMECDPYISGSAIFYEGLRVSIEMADVFKDSDYKAEMEKEAKLLKAAFNKQWLQPVSDSLLWYGSQTATVLALQYNLVPQEFKQSVVAGLLYDITVTKNMHHNVGIHGHKHLYTVLSNLGYKEMAWKVLTNPTFPSHAYIVNSGITTWPERQFKYAEDEWDRSMNHPMNANFTSYFFEELGGLRPLIQFPGFKKFVIDPQFPDSLQSIKVSHQSPYGLIVSNWQRKGNTLHWQVQIPPNSTALVHFPTNNVSALTEENNTDLESKRINSEKDIVLNLGSGTYRFNVEL